MTSILVDCPTQQYLYLDFHLLCSMTKIKEHNREICCLNPVSAVSMWLRLRMMTLTTVAECIANCHPGDQFLTWPTPPLSKPRLLTTGSLNITLCIQYTVYSILSSSPPSLKSSGSSQHSLTRLDSDSGSRATSRQSGPGPSPLGHHHHHCH